MPLQKEGGGSRVAERCWCKKSGGGGWQWDWVSLLLLYPALQALQGCPPVWRWEGTVCEHRKAMNWLLNVKNWANVKENWRWWIFLFQEYWKSQTHAVHTSAAHPLSFLSQVFHCDCTQGLFCSPQFPTLTLVCPDPTCKKS